MYGIDPNRRIQSEKTALLRGVTHYSIGIIYWTADSGYQETKRQSQYCAGLQSFNNPTPWQLEETMKAHFGG